MKNLGYLAVACVLFGSSECPVYRIHLSDPIELYNHVDNQWGNNDPDDVGSLRLRSGQTVYITACAASASLRYLDSNNHLVLGNVGPASNPYRIVIP